ncbi:hypothetical protein COB52_04255 [Candidatus Kaiserbacteria bacterium]|nr:MAG: hypothetical protein COB52_04255 [Candidatus Kaiserbacteria bacterium]
MKFQGSPKGDFTGKISPEGTGSILPKTVRFIKKSPSPSQVSPQRSPDADPNRSVKIISSK